MVSRKKRREYVVRGVYQQTSYISYHTQRISNDAVPTFTKSPGQSKNILFVIKILHAHTEIMMRMMIIQTQS